MYDKKKFVNSYISDAEHRYFLAKISFDKQNYHTVIRECQTLMELSVKALVFSLGRVIPNTHNLKDELNEIKDLLSESFQLNFDRIYKLAAKLRIERERAMYGDPDLNKLASEIYDLDVAEKYLNETRFVLDLCKIELKNYLID